LIGTSIKRSNKEAQQQSLIKESQSENIVNVVKSSAKESRQDSRKEVRMNDMSESQIRNLIRDMIK
jgi:hypothetical protein